ncbi:3-hydroxyacyl-ACP dehydratase FabZ [Kutzneria viridogrisea]|uniref:Uncharacterized protein n=2 Tax=Kutzneria TaxID=43356 RepID=W5WEM2_9PSEU|nr:hypothetical protein KALB_6268 [Kutzneria albida DSM 43870]
MTPVDKVIALDPGEHAMAVRNVASTLDVFRSHFPRRPVLPGVLILDDMVAVARLALGEVDGRWTLVRADRLRYRHFVRPGQAMGIRVDVVGIAGDTATCRAAVSVGDRVVTTADALVLRREVR